MICKAIKFDMLFLWFLFKNTYLQIKASLSFKIGTNLAVIQIS
jgi:hypothetical protein